MAAITGHAKSIERARSRLFGLSRQRVLVAVGLGFIILLGAFLRFYQLGAYSIGNTYYAATVQSMLTSWHNFFYAAFEPGGSVSVDKPPLGFWIQAASAYCLGVNGFALAMPHIFERFYRGDAARHDCEQSDDGESGLGLAIARSIVELHGGTITADSAPGKGTTMAILLPAQLLVK